MVIVLSNEIFFQFGKSWIEKQLKTSLSRFIIESVNTKLIVLFIVELLSSPLSSEELEEEVCKAFFGTIKVDNHCSLAFFFNEIFFFQFINVFSIRNICLIRTFLNHRDSIKEHCKFIHHKKGKYSFISCIKEVLGKRLLKIVVFLL